MGSVEAWAGALEARHLTDLRFRDVSRAVRALSRAYVEDRRGLEGGGVFAGAGKRAAFALFYGPLHFLLVDAIVRQLGAAASGPRVVVDLGCGSGAAGVAWARAFAAPPRVTGIDCRAWAVREAAWTYKWFGLRARTVHGDLEGVRWPEGPAAFVAAYTLNEVRDTAKRESLWRRLLDRAARGDRVLVVEPLAGAVAPWWNEWKARAVAAGGRADEWRPVVALPPVVARLDRAAGLDHSRELTGRSLWLGGREGSG